MTSIAGLGLAAFVLILASPPTWRRAAFWAALGLIGYAASLSLIEAGPVVRYQHYLPPGGWRSEPAAALVLLGEFMLVVAGLWRARPDLREFLPAPWRGWRLIVLAGFIVLTSAVPSRDLPRFLTELPSAGIVALTHLGALVLAGLAVPTERAARLGGRLPEWLESPAGSRVVNGFAVGTTVFAGLLAWLVYQRHPHVPDEVIYLIHARYFAAGLLWLPPPVPPEAFDTDLMFLARGHWYSPVPPAWPAMLAVGVKVGAAWLVNPVLAGINVWLTARAVEVPYGTRAGRLTAILLALSPWHLFLGMSFLTHTFTLTCALLAALAVGRGRNSSSGWMIAGGAMTGVVSLIRPLEGLAVAIVLGLWSLGGTSLARRLWSGLAFTLGAIVTGAITLPYNAALTGSATRFPIMAYTDEVYGAGTNALGFGPNRGLGWSGLDPFPGHGLRDVLLNSDLNIFAGGVELLGWATGSLIVILALLVSGRFRRGDGGMLLAIAVVVGLHAAYWFSGGPDFGARYWFLTIVPALGLTARGLLTTTESDPGRGGRVALVAATLVLGALVGFIPWRAEDKYWHYRGMQPEIRSLVARPEMRNALVLIRGRRHPDWASAAMYNPLRPDRESAPVLAWDRGDSTRARLLEAFPGRLVWLVDGPSLTGNGYRIVAGPLEPGRIRIPDQSGPAP